MHLNYFQDKREVVDILRSHGFAMTDCGTNEVRVTGSFLRLKSVKVHLEQLLEAQKQTNVYSSSHCPVSSGAIPKNHYNSRSVSGGNSSRVGSRHKLPHASASSPNTSASRVSDTSYSHPSSPQYRASYSLRPDQCGSVRHRNESFAVEGDVFMYAQQVRHKDMNNILERHNVRLRVDEVGESFYITLEGKSERRAAGELQSFLNYLTRSLRTQEVPHKDMSDKGKVVLQRIRENSNIYYSVLVYDMNDRLRLIGPSAESYELKQILLEKSVDQSGRTGRTFDRNSRKRSSSLPAGSRKNADRDGGGINKPSPVRAADHSPSKPVGATGNSPSKYEDDKKEDPEPEPSRRRSWSVSCQNKQAKSRNGYLREMKNKHLGIKNMTKKFLGLFKK